MAERSQGVGHKGHRYSKSIGTGSSIFGGGGRVTPKRPSTASSTPVKAEDSHTHKALMETLLAKIPLDDVPLPPSVLLIDASEQQAKVSIFQFANVFQRYISILQRYFQGIFQFAKVF